MVENHIENKVPLTLTDRLRLFFKPLLERMGIGLYELGIRPNMITLFGLIGTVIGTIFVASGNLMLGGFFILLMGPIDALDGAVARASGTVTRFGAFLDSVIDRYIESLIYAGLIFYFNGQQQTLGIMLSFFSLVGSVLVSYARARAESLGIDTKIGILTRVERLVVIGPTIFFKIPLVGVAVVAVLANFTALQRINHVKKQIEAEE
ncbi:MAG: CDP-alcohol phosphatidyltransferase family protein [Anaerolineales bacterium]